MYLEPFIEIAQQNNSTPDTNLVFMMSMYN